MEAQILARTQVGIVGAGPAGLVLAQLLHLQGIDSVILENRSRAYCEDRVRAGVLEQGTVDLLVEIGVGEHLKRIGLIHTAINLRFSGQTQRIDLADLTGGAFTIYGQHEVTKDLNNARLATGRPLLFEVDDVRISGFDGTRPTIHYRESGGEPRELACDFIAGCDGFHGICRPSVPAGALTIHRKDHPFGWLGILVQVPPSSDELIYAYHQRGFALLSMRTPEISRLYIQYPAEDDINDWSDERVWRELHARLACEGWSLIEGPVLQKSIAKIHSFVADPMQYGSLFLAGDAAHIVPPTGAKGLNLAVADVQVLARAFQEFYSSGRRDLLNNYSETCLRRIWKVQRFSWWMTAMLHRWETDSTFDQSLQLAELEYITSSRAAAQSFAENYVGLPME